MKIRKLWVRQFMMKRHSKQEFCEPIVTGLFSSNFVIFDCTMFAANEVLKNLFLVSLVSLVPDIFVILDHIYWLVEVNFCLKRTVVCGKCLIDMSQTIKKSIKY